MWCQERDGLGHWHYKVPKDGKITFWLVKSNKICYSHRFLHENLGLFILLYSTRFSVPVDGEKIDNVREW